MAQLKSIIKLQGKIGDLTFFKTQNGYQAREKTGVSASRIASDPKFQRTRENNAEFGRAGSAAKKLRDALRPFIQLTSDSRMANRLSSRLLRIIKADTVNDRGERTILPDNLQLLRNFNFNAAAEMSNTFFIPLQGSIDAATGTGTINFPAFDPKVVIARPDGATHYQFSAAIVSVDFSEEVGGYLFAMDETPMAPINDVTEALSLAPTVGNTGEAPLFLAVAISFYQEVNGKAYSLNNGAYNALTLVNIHAANIDEDDDGQDEQDDEEDGAED
ncbi:hypothetical protein H8S90_13905 [Olivibacter sp. SDN3]|uniref:hypothetical protein n=1 Tax=Olivibacter sp. SDN3 TaxID=2764720 RepID=UPI001651A53E|nr:hypothetical protein [Olivibacter sp. SDN3]QNL47913.1 hypothetical protein H8S90_13905 [Olivibacter sp. SDN3]